MTRANWKQPYITKMLFKKSMKLKNSDYLYEDLIIRNRNGTIITEFIGTSMTVDNGTDIDKNPDKIVIQDNMIGHKFGEFSLTKKGGSSIHKDNKIARKIKKRYNQLIMQKKKRKNKGKTS